MSIIKFNKMNHSLDKNIKRRNNRKLIQHGMLAMVLILAGIAIFSVLPRLTSQPNAEYILKTSVVEYGLQNNMTWGENQ